MPDTAAPARPVRTPAKGQQTKAVIIDAALSLAAQIGDANAVFTNELIDEVNDFDRASNS